MYRENKKRILFIILEIESASGFCILNVAEELQKRGWMVDLLSYKIENAQFDKKSLNFIEIKPRWWLVLTKKFLSKKLQSVISILHKTQIAITIFMWPWNSPFFSARLYKIAVKCHEEYEYDCIVPVYTQIDSLIVGFLLKKKYLDIKVIPYFIDSLSAGPTPRLLTEKMKIKKGINWEKILLKNMDGIVYMKSSEQHHRKYSACEKYFAKVEFLDIPMFKTKKRENDTSRELLHSLKKSKIEITYVGSMPLSIRNPKYAFEVLSEIKGIELEINIVGASESCDIVSLKNVCTKSLKVNWIERVTHEKALKYIEEADILLNIGNNVSGMVPSKIFEYISYTKPILSFAPILKEPSIPYLLKYPAACIIFENDSFCANVRKVQDFIDNTPECKFTNDELKQLYYLNTPECYANYISSKV